MTLNSMVMAAFQDSNPERFNEDLIYMRKKEQEEIETFFHKLFSSLGIPYVEFISLEIIHDEFKQREYFPDTQIRTIEESRLSLIVTKFKLDVPGEEEAEEYTFLQFFPKLVDDFFFNLIGNRYFSIYQITDKNFYSTRKSLFLKTLLMPLGIQFSPFDFESMEGNKFNGLEYRLDIFRSKAADSVKNIFLYYYIEYGEDAFDYVFNYQLGKDDTPNVFIEDTYEEYEDYNCFQIRKDFFIYFKTELMATNANFANLVCSAIMSLKGTRKSKDLLFKDLNYFKKKIINTNNINKADKALLSMKRILDDVSKETLDLPEEDKADTFAIARYMAWNFHELFELDTVDLRNRRLRLFEYMVYPLLKRLSNSAYRILNSRNISIKRVRNVFTSIPPTEIIKNLVNNELLRYYNATSTLELFSVILRYSARGPQALGNGSTGITLKYRGVHESYVGNVSLSMASASDPGMTGGITPLTKNVSNFRFNLDD